MSGIHDTQHFRFQTGIHDTKYYTGSVHNSMSCPCYTLFLSGMHDTQIRNKIFMSGIQPGVCLETRHIALVRISSRAYEKMWYDRVRWFVRQLNGCFDMMPVNMDWRGALIGPCKTGKVTSMNLVTREVLVG